MAIAIYQAQFILRMYPNPCGSWPASEGVRLVDDVFVGWGTYLLLR
ncbi:hypothetical protein SRM1_03739 [Pseudomonas fluorescens]|nr:hypothetical protein SRM1_03739 [Pseudomonas fluorescens]